MPKQHSLEKLEIRSLVKVHFEVNVHYSPIFRPKDNPDRNPEKRLKQPDKVFFGFSSYYILAIF